MALKLINKIDEKCLIKICKIMFFISIFPFILETSGTINWNTDAQLYKTVIYTYLNTIKPITFVVSGVLVVLCYIFEIALAYKLYKEKKIIIQDRKSLIFKLVLITVTLITCEICAIKIGSDHILKWLIFVPLTWIIDFDDLIDYVLISLIVKFVLTLVLMFSGVVIDASISNHAHSLGFTHANCTGYVLFFITLLLSYKYIQNKPIAMLCISIVSFIIQTVITQCRTAIILTLVLILCLVIYIVLNRKENVFKAKLAIRVNAIYKHIALILLIVTILAGAISFYLERNNYQVDSNFICRFVHLWYYYERNGVSLMARPDIIIGKYMFDNIYTEIAGMLGVIPLILVFIYFTVTNKEVSEGGCLKITMSFMFYFLYSLMESAPFSMATGIIYFSYIIAMSKEIVLKVDYC